MDFIFVLFFTVFLFVALILISAVVENRYVKKFFAVSKVVLSTVFNFVIEILMIPAWAFYKVFER